MQEIPRSRSRKENTCISWIADDWAEPTMLERYVQACKAGQRAARWWQVSSIDTYYDKEHYVTDDYVVEDAVYPDKESFRRNAYKLFDQKSTLYTVE